jgi:hypothetical protein
MGINRISFYKALFKGKGAKKILLETYHARGLLMEKLTSRH